MGLSEAWAARVTAFTPVISDTISRNTIDSVFRTAYLRDTLRTIPTKFTRPSALLIFKTEAYMKKHYTLRLNVMTGTPEYRENAVGYGFDMREGRFCSHAPIHRDYLQPQDAEKILQLMRMSAHNMHLFRMTRAERNRITDTILHFYRLHIPAFPELRSLDILREL